MVGYGARFEGRHGEILVAVMGILVGFGLGNGDGEVQMEMQTQRLMWGASNQTCDPRLCDYFGM
jgi:hypothetical protein